MNHLRPLPSAGRSADFSLRQTDMTPDLDQIIVYSNLMEH